MDSTPTAKRRKLNTPLNKPFKSPLRTSAQNNAQPKTSSLLVTAPVKLSSGDRDVPGTETPLLQSTTLTRDNRVRSNTPASAENTDASDPVAAQEIQITLKDIRSLEATIIRTRQEIDTMNQAIALATSTKDAELSELSYKWKSAARQAAEEVFATARDRVNRMGGVAAWRERESEARERMSSWDEVPEQKEQYDEDGELIEVDEREVEERIEETWEYDEEVEAEAKKDLGRDDDSFTMDMMLKMMNIDLELIGYSKQRQRWVG